MSRRLLVLLAGDPVPSAEARFGSFAHMFQRALGDSFGLGWSTLDLRVQPALPPATEIAGVLVSGSAAYVDEALPWMTRAVAYLSELRVADVPTLGICFGHQLLGLATGGQVARNPRGREIGTVELAVTADNPLMARTASVRVNASHLDSVVALGQGTARNGHTALERNAVVHFGARSWGVQFHPEFSTTHMHGYINARADILKQEGLDPAAIRHGVRPAPKSRALLSRFARLARGRAHS
jgi:GMP synthase (glutamine-hydrolysing)